MLKAFKDYLQKLQNPTSLNGPEETAVINTTMQTLQQILNLFEELRGKGPLRFYRKKWSKDDFEQWTMSNANLGPNLKLLKVLECLRDLCETMSIANG